MRAGVGRVEPGQWPEGGTMTDEWVRTALGFHRMGRTALGFHRMGKDCTGFLQSYFIPLQMLYLLNFSGNDSYHIGNLIYWAELGQTDTA